MKALTKPLLDQAASPNRLEDFSAAGCSLLTNEVPSPLSNTPYSLSHYN